MKIKATIAAAVLALTAAVPAYAVNNLIINGSFEDGLTGFVYHTDNAAPLSNPVVVLLYGSAGGYGTNGGAYGEAVPVDNAVAPSPAVGSPDAALTHGAYFVDDFAHNESLSQLTILHPGNYEIGFDAYLPQNGANNGNDAAFAGSIIGVNVASFTASQVGATHWFHFGGTASITQSGYYLTSFTFNSFGSPAKDVVIDKVYVVASKNDATFAIPPTPTGTIPEPATWALMLGGLGLIGVSMRRRNAAYVAA